MNVGFDLDKIFVNFPLLIPSKVINWFYKEKSGASLKYRIPSRIEQIIRIFTHYPVFRLPINENIKYIRNLASVNKDKYYLISSRFGFLEKRTSAIVKRYKLDKLFNGMFFNYNNKQPHIFKNEVLKKLNLDMYIDDDIQLLEYLVDRNPKTKFFWLNNKVSKQLNKNLFAIKNIAEMFK
ncbi:MAG: hypothetical protein Q7K54_04060 [Candidatus Parcubacteria bacterium]|nr:hypothetical protein [Candidatus Parcubacteria bacterium]